MKTKQNMLMKGVLTLSMIMMVAFVTMGVKRNALPANTEPSAKATGVFFSDNFETGDLSKSENGFVWSTEVHRHVPVAKTPNGTLGLKFVYGPDGLEEDGWAEGRFKLGNNYSDLWIKYDLYVPENFHHRCPIKCVMKESVQDMQPGDTVYKVDQNGTITNSNDWGIVFATLGDSVWVDKTPTSWVDNVPKHFLFADGDYMKNKRTGVMSQIKEGMGNSSDNNKLILLWQGVYGSKKTGNSIEVDYWNMDRGNSCLSYYLCVDHGTKLRKRGHTFIPRPIIEKCKDAGKWMELIFHFKIASSADNDGIIHVVKNGKDYLNVRNIGNHSVLGTSYLDSGYLLGWSNSGYTEETTFYIDNIVFSTDSISPGQ